MNKTCKDAYDIYEQYHSIHKNCHVEKIKYIKKVLDTYSQNDDFASMASLITLVIYIEKTIGSCQLSDYHKGELMNVVVKIPFKCYPHYKVEQTILVERLMVAIMD